MTMPVTIISYWKKKNRKFYYGDKETKYTCTWDFKTLNNLNPNFTKEIFYISSHNPHTSHDIFVQSWKTTKYGDKSLRSLCLHLWNSCQKKLNLQHQYLYSKIWSKFGLDLNVNVNCATSNPLYT